MNDLSDLLAAEARRQEPTDQPALAVLVRRRRTRNLVVSGIAVLPIVGALIAGAAWYQPAGPHSVPPASPTRAAAVPVSGVMSLTGGPAGASPAPVNGTIYLTRPDGTTIAAATDDGHFTIMIPPGRYTVTGRSPAFGAGQYLCHAEQPITVSSPGLPDVNVSCARR